MRAGSCGSDLSSSSVQRWGLRSVRVRLAFGAVLLWWVVVLSGCTPFSTLEPEEHATPAAQPTIPPKPTVALAERPTRVSPQPTAPPVGLEKGNTAPDFTLTDLEGNQVTLSDLRGQVVMINFWATWCGFCRVELPVIQSVYETHRDSGFVVLAIDVQESAKLVGAFVEDMGMTFPVLLDSGEVTYLYDVRGLPMSFFIDQNGVIYAKHIGPVDESSLKRYLAQAGVE